MTSHDMSTFLDERGHVPANEMARYIDGDSDRESRSRVTHHLADCEECREELTAIRRLAPPRSRMGIRVGAILSAAAPDLAAVRKLAEIPFDFVRKRVSVVLEAHGQTSLVTKGAFHNVLEICTRSADGMPLDAARKIELQQDEMDHRRLQAREPHDLVVGDRGLA